MFCEQAEKREKKDFSFINLTFAAFWFLPAASPDCAPRDREAPAPFIHLDPLCQPGTNLLHPDSMARG